MELYTSFCSVCYFALLCLFFFQRLFWSVLLVQTDVKLVAPEKLFWRHKLWANTCPSPLSAPIAQKCCHNQRLSQCVEPYELFAHSLCQELPCREFPGCTYRPALPALQESPAGDSHGTHIRLPCPDLGSMSAHRRTSCCHSTYPASCCHAKSPWAFLHLQMCAEIIPCSLSHFWTPTPDIIIALD